MPAQPGVVDGAAVLAGVDDADHGAEQLGQVGRATDLVEHAGMFELGLQRHRVGELSGLDAPGDGRVNAAMDGVNEMLGCEELADPFVGLVVGQQRAKQSLLGDTVGGRQAGRQPEQAGIEGGRGDVVHRSADSSRAGCPEGGGVCGQLCIAGTKSAIRGRPSRV